jgi:hypothetical protein
MNININLKGAVTLGVCLATEAMVSVLALREACRQNKRAIKAEKEVLIMDTALDLYELANKSLSRQLDEMEKES